MMLRASSLRLAGAALLSFAVAAPAIAAGNPPSVAAASDQGGATAAPKKERKICKTSEATESRMAATRICKTAAEWHADQASGPDMSDMKTVGGGKVH
jgi:hypothetical protein